MAGTTRAVFLSYRREETRHIAGRLADRLCEWLGSTQVFMDVDIVEPGADFAATIAREVASCDVLIALIGPTWLTITDRRGRRRLDDPDDFVVLEIRAALERGIRVIPVLVDGAIMPDRYDLPETLQSIARRAAVPLDHETFRSDVAALLDAIDRILPAPTQKAAKPWMRISALAIHQASKWMKANQMASQARKVPASTEQWRVDVSKPSFRRILLIVKLTKETHRIEMKRGNYNTVAVDGIVVARDGSDTESTFNFSLADGGFSGKLVLRKCELTVRYTFPLASVANLVRLSVEDDILYEQFL